MRFAHYRTGPGAEIRLAAGTGSGAYFVDELMPKAPRDLQELIERGPDAWADMRERVTAAERAGREPADTRTLHHASAVVRPPAIIAIGANYAAHSSELALRVEKAPTVFSLWPNSLTGHDETTSWSRDDTLQVDYEAELGVVIGRRAREVSEREALDVVFGYTVVNDITARDRQFSEAQWSRCKSFDGFTPTGPVVVTADEIRDPQNLWLSTNLDGRVMQDQSSGDMVHPVAELIAYLSRTSTLLPGTLISTGSPGGAGYSRSPQVFLDDGATVTVSIGGIGSLRTHCRVV